MLLALIQVSSKLLFSSNTYKYVNLLIYKYILGSKPVGVVINGTYTSMHTQMHQAQQQQLQQQQQQFEYEEGGGGGGGYAQMIGSTGGGQNRSHSHKQSHRRSNNGEKSSRNSARRETAVRGRDREWKRDTGSDSESDDMYM